MTLDTRSTKRRRVSGSSKPIAILAPGEESPQLPDGQEKFTRHADFWLDDGNLILLAGDTAFRVYKGILVKKSAVFSDMFAAGSANATERFDGCPIVRLPDHPRDLGDFLQYLIPSPELTLLNGQPMSDFAELHAAFHLAHKYQCPDVEARVLSVLKKFYTVHFADYRRYDASKPSMPRPPDKAAIAAVNIARLANTPSMLPFALYEVCTLEGKMMDGYARRDSSVEHLAAADIRLCIDARPALGREMVSFVKTVFTLEASDYCDTMVACVEALAEISEDVEMDTPGTLCSVLSPCDAVIMGWAEQYELCEVCMREMLEREVAGRRRAWKLLPGIFGFTAEACGFTIDDGPSASD